MTRVSWTYIAVCLSILVATDAPAQQSHLSDDAEQNDAVVTVRVAASERYRAGRVHRFVLGGGYRDLWEKEIELPLLNLEKEGGGLIPTGRFGGLQTAVLGFKGKDGRLYSFRGTDKDPSAVLDSLLRDTIVEAIVQDQMAAQHPGGPLAAGVLTDSAGVLTVVERMVVLPDDPRLGEYREEFAGMVGTFFEYPQPASTEHEGYHDAIEMIDHEELYERLSRADSDAVDLRAFLRARLMDLLLGDFDRHRKQWRWAKFPGDPLWQPIPEDRDQAFVRYDGAGQRLMKIYIPILQRYDESYPFIKGLTLHGWEQDRWLLPSLGWEDWESIVAEIQSKITNDVIDRAILALPPEYREIDGERLRKDLTGRRDRLGEAARSFYEHLAREVDVQMSDAAQRVRVNRQDDGAVLVEVHSSERDTSGADALLFRRRFDPGETRDIRLYLRGGEDRVVVDGESCCIRVRVIADGGKKVIDDSAGGGSRIYDSLASAEVVAGPGTRVDNDPYELPPSDSGFVDVENVPPRDWGSDTIPIPEFGYQKDVGAFLGVAAAHTRYGFRKHPWSSKHSLGFGWAFEANAPRVGYRGQFRPENSKLVGALELQYSGIEVLRFYGFGNETNDDGQDRFFRVRNQQYRVSPSVSLPILRDDLHLAGGPYLRVSRTANGSRLIDVLAPYGNNDFGLVGGFLNLRLDTRRSIHTTHQKLELPFHDNPAAGYPTSGFLVDVTGRFNPPLWDVDNAYGSVEGSISGYLSVGPDARATLGVRVGGKETFGKTPYFDLAYIGGGRFFSGSATARGFRTRRFAGDSSVYGNVDLRVFLGRVKIVVPSDFGIHGFFDVGRVFFHDENSDNWHPSGGGGVWISPLVRTNTISLSAAHSTEETLIYLRIGFHY